MFASFETYAFPLAMLCLAWAVGHALNDQLERLHRNPLDSGLNGYDDLSIAARRSADGAAPSVVPRS